MPNHPCSATLRTRRMVARASTPRRPAHLPSRSRAIVRRIGSRTHVLLLLLLVPLLLLSAESAVRGQAAGPVDASRSDAVTAVPDLQEIQRIEAAVDQGLAYLAQHQRPDGSFPGMQGNNNGINALCLLAMLGRGHVPGRGPYQPVVDRAITFILSTQRESGLYQSPNASHGPMYEHALATLAMIQAYGFIPTQAMHTSVQSAVDLIVRTQSDKGPHAGGWRYRPRKHDADLSVTVMQIVALRAAINARLIVPQQTVDDALAYVRRCIVDKGGFAYQPGQHPRQGVTAAGCLSLQLFGAFDDPAVEAGLNWLLDRPFKPGNHFWYTNYYAMQAMFQAGDPYWSKWSQRARPWLLDHQQADGSWPGYHAKKINGPEARCYSTAFAVISLEVFLHYLPVYQR